MELELFTTFGNSWQDKFHHTAVFRQDPGIENQAVNLYPDSTYRTLEGFGGAITDSAAHFSHYLLPESVQIGYSRYTEQIDVTAWKRPDDRIAVVLLNKSGQIMPVCLRMEGFVAECLLCPQSITTGIIRDRASTGGKNR